MSLIQALSKIKAGIENGDMQLVADGYEILSGDKVVVKENFDMIVEEKPKKGRPKKNVTTLVTTNKVDQILLGRDKKPNKFTDNGELFVEDKIIDAKLHIKSPVKRRPPAQILQLSCQECGKQYELSSELYVKDARKLCGKCCKR